VRLIVLKSEFPKIKRNLAKLKRSVVTVGVHGDAGTVQDADGKDTGYPLPELAAVHEFGTKDGKIPERSFLRSAIEKSGEELTNDIDQQVQLVVEGKATAEKVMTRAGVLIVGAVKEGIAEGIAPPLAPRTIEARDKKAAHGGGLESLAGQHTPLIDTGQLFQSIVFKVGSASATE